MAFDWTTFWFVLIIGLLVVGFFLALYWAVSLTRKKKKMPSHLQLYFDENFRRIIDEWDLTSRDRAKEFKKDMSGRLSKVEKDISTLESRRKKLDSRLGSVERKMDKLERI